MRPRTELSLSAIQCKRIESSSFSPFAAATKLSVFAQPELPVIVFQVESMGLWCVLMVPFLFFAIACQEFRSASSLIRRQHQQPDLLLELFPNDSWIDRRAFPDRFKFGALTWAVKHEAANIEDNKGLSIWDAYSLLNGTVDDGTTPADGGDQYHHYIGDVQLLKDMGMDSYKFSIAWTRLYPNGTGELNQKGVEYYNSLLDTLIDQGIEPFVSLIEQDMPQMLENTYSGLLSPLFIDDFVSYANTCFALFGDRVEHWVTFEEGNDYVPFAYAGTWSPPGRCTPGVPPFHCPSGNSSTEPYIAAHIMLLAHASVVQLYRTTYQASQQGEIGLAIWFRWFEPLTDSPMDIKAAQRATDFTVGWFVEPLLYGDYPKIMKEVVGSRLPPFTSEQKVLLRGSVDFIGLNAVTAIYATSDEYQANCTYGGYFEDFGVQLTKYDKNGDPIGEFAGEYSVPWCMEKIVGYMRTMYDNFPTYITAIGYGLDALPLNETLDDVKRVEFYSTYLKSLIEGIKAGADVRGLFAWSLIDGFELIYGLATRFGLYYVDEKFVRTPGFLLCGSKAFLQPMPPSMELFASAPLKGFSPSPCTVGFSSFSCKTVYCE